MIRAAFRWFGGVLPAVLMFGVLFGFLVGFLPGFLPGAAEATKPVPPVEATWVAAGPFRAGERVTATLVVAAARSGRIRVSAVPGPALDWVVGSPPSYEGAVDPEAPLSFPVAFRVPPGPTSGLEVLIEVDGPGGALRIGAALDLTPHSARGLPLPGGIAAADGSPVLERTVAARIESRPRASAAAASITLRGRYRYRDRVFGPGGFLNADSAQDPVLPVRFARVELIRDGTVAAATATGSSGDYSFVFDPVPGAQYLVRLLSQTGPWDGPPLSVRSSAGTPALYAVISPTFSDPVGDVTQADVVVEPGVGEAFNILDACVEGCRHVRLLHGEYPAQSLNAYWSNSSLLGTYFIPGSSSIYLLADEGYDDCVVLHEFGHYVLFNFSKDESPGGAHFIDDSNQDPRLSWSEGFASYFQSSVRRGRGDPYPSWYVDTQGTPGAGQLFFSFEAEGPSYYVQGAGSEVAVDALLWDIEDGPATPGDAGAGDDDGMELDPRETWEVISGPMNAALEVTLEDFWDGWFGPGVANGFAAEMSAAFGRLGAEYVSDALEAEEAVSPIPLGVLGERIHRTFYPAGDQDRFALDLEAGVPVQVETLNLLSLGDTFLEVAGPESTWTNDDRAPGDPASAVRFTPEVSGAYSVRVVRAFSGAYSGVVDYGSYDIRAVAGVGGEPLFTAVGGAGAAPDAGFSVGAALADMNDDGRPDLMVVNNAACGFSRGKDALYRNDGSLSFSNVTTAAGLGSREGGIAAAWGDFNNDSLPDLFVTDHGLYQNFGNGEFLDVTTASGVTDIGREYDAAWVDADGDGRLDLFVVRRDGPSALWHNRGNGTFEDVAPAAGFGFPAAGEEAYACAWGDADLDGDLDLFLARWKNPGHAFYRNLGNGSFEDDTADAGLASEVPASGAVWGDVNGDGLLDLFVASAGPDRLYVNLGGGGFEDRAPAYGVNDVGPAAGAGLLDADLDGDLDLYVAGTDVPQRFYRNLGGTMARTGDLAEVGLGYAAAWGDLDGDGDPEIYQARGCDGSACGSSCQTNRLYRNLASDNAPLDWVNVALVGRLSNRDGIGARVVLHQGGGIQRRDQGTGHGWASKSLLPVHFGLGESAMVDSIEVFWPSGVRDVLIAPLLNRTLVVTESDKTPVEPPGEVVPLVLTLLGPSPNPFREGTAMALRLTRAAEVEAAVFDVAGRRVRTLVSRRLEAGSHLVGWDGEDDAGRPVAPGLYLYRARAGDRTETRKLLRVGF